MTLYRLLTGNAQLLAGDFQTPPPLPTLLSPGTRPQCPRSLLLPTSPFASSTSLGPDHSVHGLVHSTFLYTGLTKECHQVQGHSVQGPTSLQTDFKRSIIICDNKLELSLVVKVVKNISGK